MPLLHSPLVVAALWVVAGLVTIWVLGPAVGFLLWRGPLRTAISENPAEAEPRGDDRAYDDQVARWVAMGFRPLGRTVESMRFMTPLHWHWRSDGSRMWASPANDTFVSFSRIAGAEPLRTSALTIFEGGGLVQTASPGVGLEFDYGAVGRRVETGAADPATLLAKHRETVASFARTQAKVVKPATLAEVVAEDEALSQRAVTRSTVAGTYSILLIFVLPLFGVFQAPQRPGSALSGIRPVAICAFALMFAVIRWATLPNRVPRVVRMAVMVAVFTIPTFLFVGILGRKAPAHRGAPSSSQVGEVRPSR